VQKVLSTGYKHIIKLIFWGFFPFSKVAGIVTGKVITERVQQNLHTAESLSSSSHV